MDAGTTLLEYSICFLFRFNDVLAPFTISSLFRTSNYLVRYLMAATGFVLYCTVQSVPQSAVVRYCGRCHACAHQISVRCRVAQRKSGLAPRTYCYSLTSLRIITTKVYYRKTVN